MAGMAAGYDLSVATFSPDGRVFQVEYAMKAVENSSTAIAFHCKSGVLIAIEKPAVNKMAIGGATPRIYVVDKHCIVGICGFPSDGRQIVKHAREEAAQYQHVFGEPIPGKVLAERIAHFVHLHTVVWSVRPLGVSILLSVVDVNTQTPCLYGIEPSGACYKYFGLAYGTGRRAAKTELEKLALQTLQPSEAVWHAARILQLVREDHKDVTVEMFWICAESGHIAQRVPVALQKEKEESAARHLEQEEADP